MKTASFFEYFGEGRISIARAMPPDIPVGCVPYRKLMPDVWFRTTNKREYQQLYRQQLGNLDPIAVVADLNKLVHPHEPILLCWERSKACATGKTFCHRHLFADWLFSRVGMLVEEIST